MKRAMSDREVSRSTIAAALTVSLLAACSTPGPQYAPGYEALQFSTNRYRVSFSGSTDANRNEVEISLLRHAAEVTLESGNSHFAFYRRDGDTNLLGPYYYSYLPYTPFRTGYWRSYPWGENLRPATNYSVYTEIETLRSDQAARDPDAMEALATLRILQGVPSTTVASAAPLR
jgi:hypothetical protein